MSIVDNAFIGTYRVERRRTHETNGRHLAPRLVPKAASLHDAAPANPSEAGGDLRVR